MICAAPNDGLVESLRNNEVAQLDSGGPNPARNGKRPVSDQIVARAGIALSVGGWGPGAPAACSNPARATEALNAESKRQNEKGRRTF
jgi:hypothetical protein